MSLLSLDSLKELDVGGTKQPPIYCGPDIGGTQAGSNYAWYSNRGYHPNNGEFEHGGLGDFCWMCWDNYGKECNNGGGIGGKRALVKRIAFKGDRTACCLANTERSDQQYINGDYTCSKEDRNPNSAGCQGIYSTYCQTGDRIVTDQKCKNLKNSSFTVHGNMMETYCNKDNKNALNSECILWCDSNKTRCNKLNIMKECVKYKMCDSLESCKESECTALGIEEVKNKCKKYGLESEQGMRLYGCSDEGITIFEKECIDNNITLDACTPIELQNAKVNRVNQDQLEITKKSQEQSQKNYESTRNSINAMLGEEIVKPYDDTQSESEGKKKESEWMTENTKWLIGLSSMSCSFLICIIIVLSIFFRKK